MKTLKYKSYIIGFTLLAALLFIINLSVTHQWRMPGPLNTGHEKLDCKECHEETQVGFRQQIQANLHYFLARRKTGSTFNFITPNNQDCMSCHARDNDNHPVYRFNEPRFKEARKTLSPQYCVSCHSEHSGVRVTSKQDNCRSCHEDLKIKSDPIDIPHADLITLENWDSCLRCHDFHGNHIMEVATQINQMKSPKAIENYFTGGADPYSQEKQTPSKSTRYPDKLNQDN
ncbi:MAG: hypothetical protein KUG82_10985 [Pseudomonadales bacterium]|nr:hypothetical protein [Pseudomonadales bacterium]